MKQYLLLISETKRLTRLIQPTQKGARLISDVNIATNNLRNFSMHPKFNFLLYIRNKIKTTHMV